MAGENAQSHVDRFAGLSDRSVAVQNTRIESPNLLNIDFSERTLKVRPGFTRLNSTAFRDCCAKLDGYNDYGRTSGLVTYYTSSVVFAFGCELKLNAFPAAAVTILARGYSAGANQYIKIEYDPTLNGGLGAWRVGAYDATGAAYRTATVNDGDAARSQIGAERHLEFYLDSGASYRFRVRDGAGTEIGTSLMSGNITTWASAIGEFFIGCQPTVASAGTEAPADGDGSYAQISISDIKFTFTGSALAIAAVQVTGRQSRVSGDGVGQGTYVAYYRCDEGIGNVSASLDNFYVTSSLIWGSNPPEWEDDEDLILGTSALRFYGGRGHVSWALATGTSALIFNSTATGFRKWCVSFVYVPVVAPGETNLRAQTLLWWGTSSTVPAPLGVRVSATSFNQLDVIYRDASTTHTITLSTDLRTYANTRVRVNITYSDIASDTLRVVLHPEGVTSSFPTATTAGTPAGDPSSISDNVCVGRRCTSFTYPFTFADESMYGVIDDIVVFKDQLASAGLGPQPLPPTLYAPTLQELTTSNVVSGVSGLPSSYIQLMIGLRLNDGTGHVLQTVGSQSSTALLFPEEDDGVWWDNGFVTLEKPPEIDLVTEFSRTGPKGALIREVLVLCGGGLWGFNLDTGDIAARGFIPKGTGKASFTQYGSVGYIGRRNGYRPFRVDSSTCYPAGIRAPSVAPTVGETTTGSLTTLAAYSVYYTFRNSQTGVESNPSPVTTFTLTGANDALTVTLLQRSSDRQVNQRRIYVTAANAGAGTTAYLSYTVEDNINTTVAVTINSLGTSTTLDYTTNKEAPTGSLVKIYKDRLWVAGVPLFPTRAYYSGIGEQESFNHSTQYLDVDLNTGDPIVGLSKLLGRLVVHLRDGRVSIQATGDTSIPFALYEGSNQTGAVNHQSIVEVDQPPSLFDKQGLQFAMADDKIYAWDGSGTDNITSPPGWDRPSIEYTYRETLNRNYTHLWTAAEMPLRRQVWFGVVSSGATRADTVLVYDLGQGIWSKYRLDVEYLARVDNADNVPTVMFGSNGYLCAMYTTSVVSTDADSAGTANASVRLDERILTISGASPALTAGSLSGKKIYYYDSSANQFLEYRVVYNTTTDIYMDPSGSALPSGAVTNDTIVYGYIPWFCDFVADFGSVLDMKRLRWIKTGVAAAAAGTVAVGVEANVTARVGNGVFVMNTGTTSTNSGTSSGTSPVLDFHFGGLGRVFKIRFAPTTSGLLNMSAASEAPVAVGNSLAQQIVEFRVEAERLSAR